MRDGFSVRTYIVLSTDGKETATKVIHIIIKRFNETIRHLLTGQITVRHVDEDDLLICRQLLDIGWKIGKTFMDINYRHRMILRKDLLQC